MSARPASFAIKAEVSDSDIEHFVFDAHKTMYGGKSIAVGDQVFIFASETQGGHGLFSKGVVTKADPSPRTAAARQTPRVSIEIERNGMAMRPLGRSALKHHQHWSDGRPETELNFKLYRQATDKVVGLSDKARQFLDTFF